MKSSGKCVRCILIYEIIQVFVLTIYSAVNIAYGVVIYMSKLEKSKKKPIVAKVTPVKEIPQGRKLAKRPEYDAVFKQVIESPEKMFKLEVEGKTVKSLYAPFSFRVKSYNKKPDRTFNVALRVRNKEIYLVKSDKKE
jgi:hypothetical protein